MPKKAIVGQKEKGLNEKAEELKAAGFGDGNVPFSITDEMNTQREAGVANGDPMTLAQNEPDTKEQVSEKEEKLSDDPQVRLQQVQKKLSEISDSPPALQELMGWKQIHGDLFLLQLDEAKVFLYRYIKNQEWIQMLTEGNMDKMRSDQLDDSIFTRCVLWPQVAPEIRAGLPAGLISTVVEQIRIHSCFLDPAYVTQFTLKI